MCEEVINFRVDYNSEMLVVEINGVPWLSGNFWDFDFVRDVPALLDKLGIENYEEEFNYELNEESEDDE